jgi:hypothetical protein
MEKQIEIIKETVTSNKLTKEQLNELWFELERIQNEINMRLSAMQRTGSRNSPSHPIYEDLHKL